MLEKGFFNLYVNRRLNVNALNCVRGDNFRSKTTDMAAYQGLPSRMKPVIQSEAAECGLASIAMVADAHGMRLAGRLPKPCGLSELDGLLSGPSIKRA